MSEVSSGLKAQIAFVAPVVNNHVGFIMDYESGELDLTEVIRLFAYLVRTGLAWSLQGSYGRAASSFIDAGIIEAGSGDVDFDRLDEVIEESY